MKFLNELRKSNQFYAPTKTYKIVITIMYAFFIMISLMLATDNFSRSPFQSHYLMFLPLCIFGLLRLLTLWVKKPKKNLKNQDKTEVQLQL